MSGYDRLQRTVCLALVILLLFPAAPLRADEITTLTAVADATIQQAASTTNDGASAILRALGVTSGAIRSLVRFDLSSISSTSAVKVANLKLKVAQAPVSSHSMAVHRVTGSTQWTENGVTWDSRDGTAPNNWTTAGGDFSATAISTQPSGTTNGATLGWSILSDGSVPNIAQDWVTNPSNNNGLLLKRVNETDTARALVKNVYSGAMVSTGAAPPASLSANLGTCNGAAPSVDVFKSFLMFQTNNDTNRAVTAEIRGQIVAHNCPTTPPTVQFFRTTNETSTVNISWYVVEFVSGVSVQRGANVQVGSALNVAISPVAATRQAFVLLSKTPASADTGYNQDDPVIADLTAVNNLQLRTNALNNSHIINWQVVEFTNSQDINVQRGNTTAMTSGVASVTAGINPVDPATSFVLVSFRIPGGSASEGRLMLRGRLTNCAATCDQVTIDRSITGLVISEINYQVVTFSNGTSVQGGVQAFAGPSPGPADSSIVVPISTVDTSRSIAFASTLSGGGANWGRSTLQAPATQSLGVSAFTTALAASSLTLTRQNTNAPADLSWYVTEMSNTDPNGISFDSREDGTAANRPQLDVSFLRNVTFGTNAAGISGIALNFLYPCAASATCSYDGALVARKNGASAPTFAPNDGTSYLVDTQPVTGETIISDASSFVDPPTVVTLVDENGPDSVVTPGTQYTYKLYTRDSVAIPGAANPAAPHYSPGISATLTTSVGGGTNPNWSYRTAGTALAPPGLDPNNKVLVPSNDNNLHSMSAISGARSYKPSGATGTTGAPVQSRPGVISQGDTTLLDCDPVTAGNQPCDIAYVGSNDGSVYAFNAITGQVIWSTPAPGNAGALVAAGGMIQGGISVQLKKYSNGSFTSPNDLVFVGTRELSASANKVYALDGNTGAIVWTFNPGNMDAVNSTPAPDYSTNVIWVSTLSNGNTQPSLWKIDSVTGAGITSFSLGDISGSPTLNSNAKVVYVVTDSGNLAAVRNDISSCSNTLVTGADTGTGFPIPFSAGGSSDSIFFTTSTTGNGTLNKAVFTYNPSCGGEIFAAAGGYTNPSSIGTLSTPIADPNTGFLYVGSSDGNLYKISPTDGSIAATRVVNTGFTIGDPSLDVFLNRLYVGDSQGRIYSFDIF